MEKSISTESKAGDAIGYVRCAAVDRTGAALGEQLAAIRKYCRDKHLRLIEVFEDNGVGGNDFDRKGWKALKSYLKENKGMIKFLVSPDNDRICRNVFELQRELRKLHKDYDIDVRLVVKLRHSNAGDFKDIGGKVSKRRKM